MNGKQARLDPDVFGRGIFAALPEAEWHSLPGFPPPVVYDRRASFYREGEVARHVYLVCSGLVKTFRNPTNDRVQIISIAGEGDVLGVEAVSRESYSESASALVRTVVIAAARDWFVDLLSSRPQVSVTLVRLMNESSEKTRSLIVDLGTKKALPRVASCILLFMDRHGGGRRPEPFNLPISRQEMGALLGLSPETVSRQLRGLVDSRVIRLDHRRLTVLNVDQLRSIATAC